MDLLQLTITEEERQMTVLALAMLSINRPGWEPAIHALALKMDDQGDGGRAELFDKLRAVLAAEVEKLGAIERAEAALAIGQKFIDKAAEAASGEKPSGAT